jgi:outer membrane autotransporter protein
MWAFWSEGNLTVGEVDQTSLASVQESQTTGITFGVDKKINENRMVGAALRIGNDNVDIGSSGTFLNTDMYSLSLYGTLPFDNKTVIDGNLGIGGLQIDSRRVHFYCH